MQNENAILSTDSQCSMEDNHKHSDLPQHQCDSENYDEMTDNSIKDVLILNTDIDAGHPSENDIAVADDDDDDDNIFMDPLNDGDEAIDESRRGTSDDEYVYLSNDECDVPYSDEEVEEDAVIEPIGRPGPKSKKQLTINNDKTRVKELLETAIVISADENVKQTPDDESNSIANGRTRRSSRSQTMKNHSLPLIEEKRNHKKNTNGTKNNKESILMDVEQCEKDLFDVPLNAPFVDSSSDEDYFQPFHADNRREANSREKHFNRMASNRQSRKKPKRIPDDVYFNPNVPLHVLYSYEDSSSDDDEVPLKITNIPSASTVPVQQIKHCLSKMPPVYKIKAKINNTKPKKIEKPPKKPTVFEQLDNLKRMFKVSGIKISLNTLVKGSKTFQERCNRIIDCLHENGLRGRPTLAKCKQLKKNLKLKQKLESSASSNVINEEKPIITNPENSTTESAVQNDEIVEQQQQQQQQQQSEIVKESIHPIDSNLKCEDNLDPVNLVETIFGTVNDANSDTFNSILNEDLANELINCGADEPLDYLEHVRNI